MAAAIDVAYIGASYDVPEPTISALIDNPTIEHVKALLQKIEEKARQFEELQTDKLRADVELETAVRTGNARTKQLKESVDKGLKEIEELRKQVAAEETARQNVESELHTLKSSSSTSTTEVQALQSRILSLEAANRDALALLESKSTAHDKLAEEINTQQQRIVSLRREVSELESKVQLADNAAMQFKFREQHLQEEVELLKKRDEWHEEELKRRTGEHTKYRKEKTAQVAELQRSIEDVSQSNETLRSTETQLRNRLDEVTRKLEEAFEQIQSKDEDAARKENSSRAERDNALRLAELQKKSAESARARQQELERALSQLKEDAANEIGNLQADVNTERTDREAAERRVEDLKKRIEQLQIEASAFPQAPSTPRRGLNGTVVQATPGRPNSPFTPGASRLKAGMTMTQMVGEYSRLKSELEAERRTSDKLRNEMDGMITDLENRQPEVEELRMDCGRLQADLEELSGLLEQTTQDRDGARKAARKSEAVVVGLQQEAELLRQQLRDFGVQIRLLLVELNSRDQGLDHLTPEQRAQFEALARDEVDEASLNAMSDTGRFISQRLVAFRSITELQEQNQQLLHMVRKLGEEMEGEEARAKTRQAKLDKEELENLRAQVVEFKDTIQSLTTRSDSYIRERDMFRRMLAHRGQLPKDADASGMFGQSLNSSFMPGTPRSQSMEPSADARALADHVKLLKELQQHFDAYREEAATDQAALKRQNDELSREKSHLHGDNARLQSKDTMAQERYNLLQANYTMLKNENGELQKRSQLLAENAAKQDVRTQQVAEDLIEAKASAESMHKEAANLKLERDLWKRVESRLTEDNRSLLDERSRLNKMIADLQSLQNERELADSETRRRLQTRTEALEAELTSAKRKLDEEVEQGKKAALRREYETEQNRQRIDDLLKSSTNFKEELIAVKTQRDQLQARVDELKIELRNAEEKAQALQPRLTTRPTAAGGSQANDENALSREQELAIEVADLKRDLELKEAELQSMKDEVEQYQSIAQTAEEELQQMNETSDQYRQETDAAITEKDARISELEKRVEEISSELATTNTELSELRSKQDEAASKFNDQKNIYESELARLRDESDRLSETARLHQEDLKAQAEIAQQAQQNYEDELVKHAEATSSLQTLRVEHNTIKTEVAGYKADADAAKLSLAQGEESWAETRAKYEQEITETKNSREELKTQNRRLHTQLEDLSNQINGLKQSRATASATGEDATATSDPTANNFQDIIRYLRQEKEIVDMQYELSLQESKRLQQQLTYAQSQLEDAREKLEAERRSSTSANEQATSHSKLMQTINELNLFRESNSSLRTEARQAQEQLVKKTKEVEDLLTQLEPLKSKAREGEYELEAKNGEIKLLQEDRDRWQKRTQDIMQKYDRVDPAELQDLRDQITKLSEERDAALTAKEPLQAQIDAFPETIQREKDEQEKLHAERRAKLIEQSKGRDKIQSAKLREANENLSKTRAEADTLKAERDTLREELEAVKKARDEAIAQAESATAAAAASIPPPASVDGNGAAEGNQVTSGMSDAERTQLQAQIAAAEQKASEQDAQRVALEGQLKNLEEKIRSLEGALQTSEAKIETLRKELEAAKSQQSAASSTSTTTNPDQNKAVDVETLLETSTFEMYSELIRLKERLAELETENERLKSASIEEGEEVPPRPADEIEAEIAQLRKDYDTKAQEHAKNIDADFVKSKNSLKQKVNTILRNKMDKLGEDFEEKKRLLEVQIADLRKVQEEELARIKAEPSQDVVAVAPATNGVVPSKPALDQLSPDDIREILAKDPRARQVIMGNQNKAVAEARKKAEDELRAKAETEKEEAVNSAKHMEAKRGELKLKMATNKANLLTAQIDVVKTAATETPQRPVVEVWEIAKTTKPNAPITATRTSLAPGATPATAAQPAQQTAKPNVPQAPANVPAATGVAAAPFGAPSAILAPAARRTSVSVQPAAAPFGQPSAIPTPGTNPFTNSTNGQQPATAPAAAAGRGQPAPTPASAPAPASTIPRPGGAPAAAAPGQPGRGRGGIPRGSSLPRGGPNIRGAARGGGRGGNLQTNIPGAAGRGQGSPRGARGGMNPGAAAFAPGAGAGQKRPNDGSGGNEEKKIKEG